MRRDFQRNLGTFGSLTVNNLFLFVALMFFGEVRSGLEPQGAEPFLLLLTLLLLFPLSADPLGRIPASRLCLWPLSARQRAALRSAALALSPVLWIALAALLLMTRRPALGALFLLAAVVVPAIATAGRRLSAQAHWNGLRWIPVFPGRLGVPIGNNLRQMFSTLDVYTALVLSVTGSLYRAAGMAPVLSLVIGLALSTYAQCLFGLDWNGSGITRYRLLPLPAWQILLAKDAAFLGVLFLLVLPLSPIPGMTFGFTALAIGHFPSLVARLPQHRWRFTGGRASAGVVTAIGGLIMGSFARSVMGPAVVALSVGLYAASLYLSGRLWERAFQA